MPTFDVSSEVDLQEVRNAVDQASREVATRFDFKNTGATIELSGEEIHLAAPTEDRLRALVQVLEEKLVRRGVSMKAISYGKIEEGSRGSVRQLVSLQAGITADHAKEINRAIKALNRKGVSSQTQGDQVRVSAKQRDDLQAVISHLKEQDFKIPLQFGNFRD
jgi:uncharacterized protein YajQ (UPF0234 family)